MTTTLTPAAMTTLHQYLHFKIGSAICNVPYFNNKTVQARAALAVHVGKGSPMEITEEVKDFLFRKKIAPETLTTDSLKKIMVEQSLGIDCSGFVYHVLTTERIASGNIPLSKQITFDSRGFFRRLTSKLNPSKNIDVATLVAEKNSRIIAVNEIQPGDIITMTNSPNERDHVLLVHQVDFKEARPAMIYYSHSVAYAEDGLYGTGVRQGQIEIRDPSASILNERWIENGLEGTANHIFSRAHTSTTELRRLS